MSHKLVLATRNQGKITEFRRILDALAPGAIELIGVDQFPDLVDVDETGSTFEENSLLKARYTCQATGLPAIADDSGLCVDALNGDPGIFSARWAGTHGNDQANLEKVLDQLKDVPDENELLNLPKKLFPGTLQSRWLLHLHLVQQSFHPWWMPLQGSVVPESLPGCIERRARLQGVPFYS
jgi:hypothetical protein